MKRTFSLSIWEHSFDNRAEYEAFVSQFGADPGQAFVRFQGDEHDSLLLNLKRALTRLGHEECQHNKELVGPRYMVDWSIEFEAGDYAEADFFVLQYVNCIMGDNVKSDSKDEIIVGVNDEDHWEVNDSVIDLLYGAAPACFDSPGELYLCNEKFMEAAKQQEIDGVRFRDTVTIVGENQGQVQQKLFLLDSDIQLPPMCPQVQFEDTNERVLENRRIVGERFWHGETVPAYSRQEFLSSHFVDAGWTSEKANFSPPFRLLVISRKFWDLFRRLDIDVNVRPGKLV
jgi:hypothetical protein